jgi:predicted aminopeptidase
MNELSGGLVTTGRRLWGILLRVLAAVVVAAVALTALTQTGRYLVRAAWEEGKILKHRRPITAIIDDSMTPPAVRQKLRLVLGARSFGADSIHLEAKQSFTTFSQLQSDTLVLVLSGAYRDQLKSKTWWFPIVGRVPYKGFFDVAMAKRAEKQLEDDGFDVYLRPASAFSTLGWFNDPLVSTTLRSDSIDLANTVIHEITHNTFYAPGGADFNESFANFVGARGAAWFFRSRGSPGAAEEAEARWSDEKLMAGFWAQLYKSVDSAFKAHPDDRNERIAVRDTIYRAARQIVVHDLGRKLRTIGPYALERMRLDNGALLAHRIYLTDVDVFDKLLDRENGNLPATVSRIIELAKSDAKHPFDAIRREVGLPPATKADTTSH